jgi:SAM-dependent methyltransferase
MAEKFYDKIARQFGFSTPHARWTTEYPAGDPEQIFEHEVRARADREKRALDVGCGDGRFILRMAEVFGYVVGIDHAGGMLAVARQRQGELGVENVTLLEQNAQHTTFPAASFDVVYSRRGPTFYAEYHRLLKAGGHFLAITIGNRDAVQLKEVFGRGQGFAERDVSRLDSDRRGLTHVGFEVVSQAEYHYDEYYDSYADLELFLRGVPIFEDFDPEADRPRLERYVAHFQEPQGIRLPRHRVIDIARKP